MTHLPRFLDTNILLRYFTRDEEEKAERARDLLLRVENGEERVVVSHLVVFETVFTLQRRYKVPIRQIRPMVMDFIDLPGVHLPERQLFSRAFDLCIDRNISFADAYNAVYMLEIGLDEVYSWDRHFDRVQGITRVIPELNPDVQSHTPQG